MLNEAETNVLDQAIEILKNNKTKSGIDELAKSISIDVLEHCYGPSGYDTRMVENTTQVVKKRLV